MDERRAGRNTLVSEAKVYVEGGGDHNKQLNIRCREGFRKLLEKCGFERRMPRIVACGGREAAYRDFATAHRSGELNYSALFIDSEDAVANAEQPWEHLKQRDGWDRPDGATDEQ